MTAKLPRRKRTGAGRRLGIKDLSDSEGEEVERREACVGCRLMAHRTQCVGEN